MPTTPLRSQHEGLGARFTDFGGWEMPLQYDGVISEHEAVRESAGVFDVSHLGRFSVTGAGATGLLRDRLCNDVAKIAPGKAQYTMALNDSGGVVDDIIVWRLAEEDYWVLPNGVNFADVMHPFEAAAPEGVTLEGVQEETVLMAVQGPDAPGILQEVVGLCPARFTVVTGLFEGAPYWMAGTGYTGETGAEIAVPGEAGPPLFRALLEAGAVPCGLGARDTLRLEMGYPLWGQDLDEGTTPLQAGLEWVVAWDHDFIGREALLAERDGGIPRRIAAFKTSGRSIPRHGYAMRAGDSVGSVTSGNYSPILGCGIGMGYLTPPSPVDQPLEVEIRHAWHPVERVTPPFIAR